MMGCPWPTLASAKQEVKEELGKAERAEQELLVLETENVVKVGKEEKQLVKLGTEFVKEEIKNLHLFIFLTLIR